MRFRVEPRDIPEEEAAKRLGLSLARFRDFLPALLEKGFPPADDITGNYDLDAIDEWRRRRHPRLFGLASQPMAKDAATVVRQRLEARARGVR
jgi:hypothetical protein